MTSPVLLSICLPTYNRRDRVAALVRTLLQVEDHLEICVHVDGSTDGTYERLLEIASEDHRLHVSIAENRGRAHAMAAAFNSTVGQFVMFYDDDDDIFPEVLASAVRRLNKPLPAGVCGYIYDMVGDPRSDAGSPLPERSNFLRLRADQNVRGDKKEIVRRDLLDWAFYSAGMPDRRVPTSLIWTRLALKYDVLGIREAIGRKRYLADGYTHRIWRMKIDNPGPMILVNRARALGFVARRYRSVPFFVRSVASCLIYSMFTAVQSLRHVRTSWRPFGDSKAGT